MKQIITQKPGSLVYKNVPDPITKKGEALIEVKSIGICNSESAPYNGETLDLVALPAVMGHEFGGIIKEINGKSGKFRAGDKVSVYPQLNCRTCYYCTNKMEHLCDNQQMFGSSIKAGGMSELIAVPLKNLVKMSDSFNVEYTGIVEPTAVAQHTIGKYKNINSIIIGVGAIGTIMGILLKHNNCRFIAMDIDNRALEASDRLAADLSVNLKDKDKNIKVRNFLKGRLIDLVVVTYISKDNLDFAIETVRKNGTIIIIGMPREPIIELNSYKLFFKELNIKWSICYSYREFKEAAQLVEKNIIPAEKLVTKIFPFDKAKDAFEYKVNNFALKVIIKN